MKAKMTLSIERELTDEELEDFLVSFLATYEYIVDNGDTITIETENGNFKVEDTDGE